VTCGRESLSFLPHRGGWVPASEQATWFIAKAAQAYGSEVLAAPPGPGDAGPAGPAALGRDMARLVFGAGAAGEPVPEPLAALAAGTGGSRALTRLETHVAERLEEDAGLAGQLSRIFAGFCRQQFESGDGQMLSDLGDLLWWDDPEQAREAFERAVRAGNQHALIDLAKLRQAVLGDRDSGLRTYQRAAESPDPDVAAEALVEIGHLHARYRETPDAQAAYRRAIDTRHPRWAAEAMIGLGNLLLQLDDPDGAQAMFRQAIETGDAESRASALMRLAHELKRRGDTDGAKAAWLEAIASREESWAGAAFVDLLNQLEAEGDLDTVRDVHRLGKQTANPDTPYALVVIGNLLNQRGDTERWRAAWQQAIEVGYTAADDLREVLSPSPEDQDDFADDDEPAGLPAEFDPGNMARTGARVLEHGLPPLPEVLDHRMAIPVAHWTALRCAVVLFLRFPRHGRDRRTAVIMATFTRNQGQWNPDPHWHGTGWDHDPIASPGDLRELDGQALVVGGGSHTDTPAPGYPASIQLGRAAPAVTQIALVQEGREDRRPLDSRFGFWVVCTEQPTPFHVTALDDNGTVLADITC
jgi:tetratricopeptide (TPR) repeat protein